MYMLHFETLVKLLDFTVGHTEFVNGFIEMN